MVHAGAKGNVEWLRATRGVEHHDGSSSEQLWQKSANKRLRFASNVAEVTVASWTIGCRRNASFRRNTTRITKGRRKRNDTYINTIALAVATTFFTDTPRGKQHVENHIQ